MVSLKYTFFTGQMEVKSAVYVFGENGLITADVKDHAMARKKYGVSACYDWNFISERVLADLLGGCNATKNCRNLKDLNSHQVCILSNKIYGDVIYALNEKDAYETADGNYYIFLGYDGNDTCFMLYDDLIYANGNEETECRLYRNIDAVSNIGNYLVNEEIYDFDYKIKDNSIFFKK